MNIVSEGLFGEKFEVLQTKEAFVYGKLLSDNYEGWIKKVIYLLKKNNTHRISKLRTFVYEKNDIKSNVILTLQILVLISILKTMNNKWSKIVFLNFHTSKGFCYPMLCQALITPYRRLGNYR